MVETVLWAKAAATSQGMVVARVAVAHRAAVEAAKIRSTPSASKQQAMVEACRAHLLAIVVGVVPTALRARARCANASQRTALGEFGQ